MYTSSPSLAIQQFFYGLVGVGLYFILRNFDYRFLKPFLKVAYVTSIVLLVVTFIVGMETRGSVRWIPLGVLNFQPSEFAKPVLILVLASFWSTRRATWMNIFKSLLLFAPIGLLIFRQPDLGTFLTVLMIWLVMLLGANISFFKVLLMGILGAIAVPLSWFFLQEYQKQRFLSFLSPANDPQGVGFHVIQSMIAVGSGQFWGRGLGRGTQSRLQFLPEFRTDFIFAFIAEELGFIGSAMVLLLYSLLFFMCFKVIAKSRDHFGELIVMGTMAMLFFQITVNIGMNIGILPITGITLPLLSYGGSSILTTFISLGLVASVDKFGRKKQEVDLFGL